MAALCFRSLNQGSAHYSAGLFSISMKHLPDFDNKFECFSQIVLKLKAGRKYKILPRRNLTCKFPAKPGFLRGEPERTANKNQYAQFLC